MEEMKTGPYSYVSPQELNKIKLLPKEELKIKLREWFGLKVESDIKFNKTISMLRREIKTLEERIDFATKCLEELS